MGKKIDVAALPVHLGTGYPPPYHQPCLHRARRRLGDAAGLTQFGVNLLRLPPGVWSSQRHWHTREDEFIYVLAGEVVLVTDAGEEILKAGDCAGFRCGDPDGHHLQNRSGSEVLLLEVGSRDERDGCDYPGIDLMIPEGQDFQHRDGTPYPDLRRRTPDNP